MKTNEKHEKAFEIFYESRSISNVAKELGVSRQSVHKWATAFEWNERVTVRERNIAKGIDEKFVAEVVDKKAEMLKQLNQLNMMVDHEIITAFEIDKDGIYHPIIHIEKLKDLIDLIGLKLKIIDGNLKVMGEDIQKVELRGSVDENIVQIYIPENKRDNEVD